MRRYEQILATVVAAMAAAGMPNLADAEGTHKAPKGGKVYAPNKGLEYVQDKRIDKHKDLTATPVRINMDRGASVRPVSSTTTTTKLSANPGFSYYIELIRDNGTQRVTNRQEFHNGDRIRFHVRPTIAGFAYILLRSAKDDEKAVLFPDPDEAQNNQVQAGRDYAFPTNGYLKFDENPGTEKVMLVLSKTKIDAEQYLAKPDEQPVVIASAFGGSKDITTPNTVITEAGYTGGKTIETSHVLISMTPAVPKPPVRKDPDSVVKVEHSQTTKALSFVPDRQITYAPKEIIAIGTPGKGLDHPRVIAAVAPQPHETTKHESVAVHKSVAAPVAKVSIKPAKRHHIVVASKPHEPVTHETNKPSDHEEITVTRQVPGVLYVAVDLDHHI